MVTFLGFNASLSIRASPSVDNNAVTHFSSLINPSLTVTYMCTTVPHLLIIISPGVVNRELTAKVSTRINVCSVLQFNLVALADLYQ